MKLVNDPLWQYMTKAERTVVLMARVYSEKAKKIRRSVRERMESSLRSRRAYILKEYRSGRTGRSIAKELGLSNQHVYATINRSKRQARFTAGEAHYI